MPTYQYRAKAGPGRTIEGEIAADSRPTALSSLELQGLSPVWVREKDAGGDTEGVFQFGRIGGRDVTVFTRQLAGLIKAGVPILKALTTVAEQSESKAFQKVVADIASVTRDGNMLSESLARYPRLFSELYVNMVKSGESAGALDTILFRLADSREKEEETRRKVQAATAYPLLIVIVGVVTVFVLLAFFLPRIIEIFERYSRVRLPLPTRLLMGASGFLHNNWHWVIIAALMLWAIYSRIASLEKGRAFIDSIKLRSPLLGVFVKQSEIARFARTLSLLINAGIPLDRGLALSANTMRNAVLRAEIDEVRREAIQQGLPVSVGLKKAAHFPSLVANMAAVGEESGRLDESLDEVASFYEKEVEQRSRLMTAMLEPILILIVGAIVGTIVAAMLLPIFEISSSF